MEVYQECNACVESNGNGEMNFNWNEDEHSWMGYGWRCRPYANLDIMHNWGMIMDHEQC